MTIPSQLVTDLIWTNCQQPTLTHTYRCIDYPHYELNMSALFKYIQFEHEHMQTILNTNTNRLLDDAYFRISK